MVDGEICYERIATQSFYNLFVVAIIHLKRCVMKWEYLWKIRTRKIRTRKIREWKLGYGK